MGARTTKDRLVTFAIQAAMVVLSLVLLRWASIRNAELDRQGREEFRTLDLWLGWPGVWVLIVVVIAGAIFTIAMRLPVARGFRWGPAVWGAVACALTFHLNLYFWWAEWGLHRREWLDPVTTLLALDRFTFLDDTAVRWVLAALAGVALGCAIGRSSSARPAPPVTEPSEEPTLDSPSERVSR